MGENRKIELKSKHSSSTLMFFLASIIILVLIQLSLPLGLLYFLVILVAVLMTREARASYGVLEKSGVPVIEPTLFLGSEPTFHKTVLHLADIERFKKYGPIWGSYIGRMPHIFITDPHLIRQIFVKDFVHFGDRQDIDFGCDLMNELLEFKKGETWKLLRSFISPLFSTSKLKVMSEVIGSSATEFMTDLKEECEGSPKRVKLDCRRRLTTCLIDMLARTTLGIRVEDSKNPDNQFAQAFRTMLHEDDEYNWLYTLSLSFPFLQKLAPMYMDEPTRLLDTTFRTVIQNRIKSGISTQKDFVDLLCDLWQRVERGEFNKFGFTETTVLSQCALIFLGGYETTACMLSHLLWYMGNNPEIQEKMYEELEEALSLSPTGEIDHDLISDVNIPYITACINETLRLSPSIYRPERICNKDWSHEGISIKKGTVVMIATWAANRNPKYYPDEPDKFKPERFLLENKVTMMEPYTFTSFGFGPRNCLGMRFAYESLKLFACNIVRNFRVELRPDSKMEYKSGHPIVIAFHPLYLDLVKRNE
ncbi:Cytochrome P450 3A16 [Orchesella cincta]|uniref:Cytochrome P450 3A16 n=1 Tax=Orchesella cincta TaxID=48709 RepID=A0A1D2MGQ8_ORCCI|nr:Cytochrome P450 3A16 [Orchesella cincta]